MQKGLVSVLTPAYNTAGYIHRLLDSVLSQTYPQIEMIVIDDGSTDNTVAVVESYVQAFQDKGYTLQCFRQNNAGQSVAIKNGLHKVTGEFLVWPDSDDYYTSPKAIALMVQELENAPEEFQMVRTQMYVVKDKTFELVKVDGLNAHREEPASLFEDCLFAKNKFFYCAGALMIRTKIFYNLTKYDIYTAKDAGQNWQMMLPVLYHYRCRTILQPLYAYVVRESSHSRGLYSGYEAKVRKFEAYMMTTIETVKRIKGIPSDIAKQYERQLNQKYYKQLLNLAIRTHHRKDAQDWMKLLRDLGQVSIKEKVIALFLKIEGGTYVISGCQRLIRKLKRQ